jgi:hypothetical protein
MERTEGVKKELKYWIGIAIGLLTIAHLVQQLLLR